MTSIVEARYSVGGPCRILALSATPGTTKADVQKLIDVLRIGDIVAFDRDSPDVKQSVFWIYLGVSSRKPLAGM